MNHLGELLTAFVDGELTGAERDRVTAHLVRCERCRTDSAALRDLKKRLAGLSGSPADAGVDLAGRLLAVAGQGQAALGSAAGPGPAAVHGTAQRRRRIRRPDRTSRRPGGSRVPPGSRATRSAKGRYVVLGAVSVVVGLGAAAFAVGGSDAGPGPRITPQLELFSQEHAITTGEVPFAGQPAMMGPGPGVSVTPAAKASQRR